MTLTILIFITTLFVVCIDIILHWKLLAELSRLLDRQNEETKRELNKISDRLKIVRHSQEIIKNTKH